MSVKIRLKRIGTKKKPHFKIVVCDLHATKNSNAIEELGFYNPSNNPPAIKVNKERVNYWLGVGAEVSDTVKSIISKA
jgi:small subunit ribosomal protein S16